VAGAVEVFVGGESSPVVYANKDLDIAILHMKESSTTPYARLCTAEPESGTEVVAIGDPFGYVGSVSRGVISGIHRHVPDVGFYDMLQTDTLLNPGNSGGPLFDVENGCVAGMNTLIMSMQNGGHTGIGFAVPAAVMRDVVTSVDAGNGLAYLPVASHVPFTYMSDEDAYITGIKGAIVTNVEDSSVDLQGAYRDPMGRPVIRDIIVGVEGIGPIESAKDLDRALARGGKVVLHVVRGNGIVDVSITI